LVVLALGPAVIERQRDSLYSPAFGKLVASRLDSLLGLLTLVCCQNKMRFGVVPGGGGDAPAIAYFTSGEVPLREDLQANTVSGAPPWFIRNGQGGNEWLRDPAPDAFNGTGYLSLPFAELPQTVNPKNGFVVNANNDTSGATLDNDPLNQLRPGGEGIYFLGYAFDHGTRAGRITQALRERPGSCF
jgi:hypothetical protein